jgi:septal ring factor EnvC (AmiA/AmiB activator)
MLELLQVQQPINAMTDVSLNVKDVVMLIGGIVSLLSVFFALKYGLKATDKEISTVKEEIMNNKRGRHAMKAELMDAIKEKDEMTRARIDKTQSEMKAYSEKTDQEFKEINSTIAGVKQDTSEIKGMLNTLLSK